MWNDPKDEKYENGIRAAYNSNMDLPQERLMCNVTWWSDPVFLGKYPEDGLAELEQYLPRTWQEDLKIISQPTDFVGQNIYNGHEIEATPDGYRKTKRPVGFPTTSMGWGITPKALKWGAEFLYERYKLPVIILENGMANHDFICLDGKVHDPGRIDFINRYLLALEEAIDEGTDVRGYFYWSLMDTFEWAKGYDERFGLVFIDYATQKRIIKDSGYWYKKIIETNGEAIHQGEWSNK